MKYRDAGVYAKFVRYKNLKNKYLKFRTVTIAVFY